MGLKTLFWGVELTHMLTIKLVLYGLTAVSKMLHLIAGEYVGANIEQIDAAVSKTPARVTP